MAVVSRTANVRHDNDINTDYSNWQAVAAVQDTAAGSSVVITVTKTVQGLLDGELADSIELRLVDSAGGAIRTFTFSDLGEGVSGTVGTGTFFFTTDGTSGGAARAGTVEIILRAVKTTGAVTSRFDIESDGSPNTPATGFSGIMLDRGFIRGSTTATTALSNVSLGGAKSAPAQYDESLFTRTTLGHTLYVARTLTMDLQVSGVTPTGLSGATNSASSGNFDRTFTSVLDSRFAAAVSTVQTLLTVATGTLVGGASTGVPGLVFSTNTVDTLNADPRLTVSHLLQIDDNSYGTPPLLKNSTTGTRLTTQIGYLSANLRGSRGTRIGSVITGGVNGVAYRATLQDAAGATTAITRDVTTTTTGGETGWGGPDFMQWTSQLPGGSWTHTVTLQASVTDLTNAYLVGATVSYTLVSTDPNLRVITGSTNFSHQTGHFVPGVDTAFVFYQLRDGLRHIGVPLDAAPTVAIMRFNFTALRLEALRTDLSWQPIWALATTVNTGTDTFTTAVPHEYVLDQVVRINGTPPLPLLAADEYYVRDVTSTTFKLAFTAGGGAIDLTTTGSNVIVAPVAFQHTLSVSSDATLWTLTIPTTGAGSAAWTGDDLIVVGRGIFGGSTYSGADFKHVVGGANDHAGHSIDAMGLALGGILSQK